MTKSLCKHQKMFMIIKPDIFVQIDYRIVTIQVIFFSQFSRFKSIAYRIRKGT